MVFLAKLKKNYLYLVGDPLFVWCDFNLQYFVYINPYDSKLPNHRRSNFSSEFKLVGHGNGN